MSENDFWNETKPSRNGCLEWVGKTIHIGNYEYGVAKHGGVTLPATHVAWLLSRGELPQHKVRHTCRNSLCLTPNHLYTTDLNSRFEAHVIKLDGCWLWTGYISKGGYPRLTANGKVRDAHRISWELVNGPIPDGMVIRHLCHSPSCTNPEHLALGTAAQNSRDMVDAGRSCRGEKHKLAKLNDKKVIYIRNAVALGEASEQELAATFHITLTAIHNVVTGKSWSHIPMPLAMNRGSCADSGNEMAAG